MIYKEETFHVKSWKGIRGNTDAGFDGLGTTRKLAALVTIYKPPVYARHPRDGMLSNPRSQAEFLGGKLFGKSRFFPMHNDSDRFMFYLYEDGWDVVAYAYRKRIKPYSTEGKEAGLFKVLTRIRYGTEVMLSMHLHKKYTVYTSSLPADTCKEIINHRRKWAWKHGAIQGPFFGGDHKPEMDIAIKMRRVR